jgi:hypothetical protein|tara:strand:- start:371 stop:2299 length:1929 start_codon:yes stop_codon:yes gene_type:complete
MANYNTDNPILFLTGTVTATEISKRYEYDDETGLGPNGSNIGVEFNITVSSIDTQSIGSSDTRSGSTRAYTGLDIKTGDWLVNNEGKTCLQVIRIISKTETVVSFTAKDVDAYSYKNYRANGFAAGITTVAFFEVSDSGKPLIAGEDAAGFFGDKVAVDLLQSRFAIQEEDERFRMEFATTQLVSKGQIVSIGADGNLLPFGHADAFDFKLGVVISKKYNGRIIYIKPFNTIIDNFNVPSHLAAGSAGDTWYTSNVKAGDITNVVGDGGDKVYFQFRDAIPTVVTASIAGISSSNGDSLSINTTNYSVANFESLDTAGIVALINQDTTNHNVVATSPLLPTILKSYDGGLNPQNGDVVIVSSADAGANNSAMGITISDGNNSASVSFSTSDGTFPNTGGAYLTISATQIAADINTACAANNVDIVASTEANTSGNNNAQYPKLVLTLGSGIGGSATGIAITETAGDAAGQNFQQATAMPLGLNISTDAILTLTRADGGDIALSGQGTFVNTNGMCSSSSGNPALLVMIEDEEGSGGVAETGVDLRETQSCNNTTNDGDAVGISITYTPFSDGSVIIKVNGLAASLSNDKSGPIYFSADGGTTAKTIANITAGDSLYWNGSIAGYQLETSDDISIVYQKSSND